MRAWLLLLVLAFAPLVQSQTSSAPEALLDKMTGHWVMTGTIARKPTTHDVDVDWVLNSENSSRVRIAAQSLPVEQHIIPPQLKIRFIDF